MSVSRLDSEAHKYRNPSASQNEIRQFDVILLDDADILLNPSASLIADYIKSLFLCANLYIISYFFA